MTTTLYDVYSRPVQIGKLKKEMAGPTTAYIRQPYYDPQASNLTPTRLANLLREANEGDDEAFLTLAEEIEERDSHYRSVLSVRKYALCGLPKIVTSPTDEDKDVKIRDDVEEHIVNDPDFDDALFDLVDAFGKSRSVVELVWDSSKTPWIPKYRWRDPRWFRYSSDFSELRLRDDANAMDGLELLPFKFITFTPKLKSGLQLRAGLARPAALLYMIKTFTLKDWVTFAEVYGMPIRIGKHAEDATDTEIADLLASLRDIGTDAAAAIPNTMELELIQAASGSGRGDVLFQGLADWCDSQTSKAVLGQTMTTDDGSSLAQATIHNEVRLDIRSADARQLSACINRDLVRPYVDLNFGQQKKYPVFHLESEPPEDLKLLSESLPPFLKEGLQIEASWLRDKFGAPEPEEGAEVLGSHPKKFGEEPPPPPAFGLPGQPGASGDVDPTQGEKPDKQVPEGEGGKPGATAPQRQLPGGVCPVCHNQSAEGAPPDEIDHLVDEMLADWRPAMDPLLQPIIEHFMACESYEQALSGLSAVLERMDSTKVAEVLASGQLKARGLGDAKDNPHD